jgi:hypothetical protein
MGMDGPFGRDRIIDSFVFFPVFQIHFVSLVPSWLYPPAIGSKKFVDVDFVK